MLKCAEFHGDNDHMARLKYAMSDCTVMSMPYSVEMPPTKEATNTV